ncbi:pyridoxal-phosphate dependent enzyme, partial [uncultured Adlercreutzia sp.]|uniref:pyridoxal-phosphate dependent enzyme n=1 Tax=uncultured Adlercreutzia sp. TaxID=875803 RepID=UPI0026F406EE
ALGCYDHLSGGAIGTHVQMGIGDGILPAIMDTELIDEIVVVTDEEALDVACRMASEEGIFCGISSGTNVACALQLARKLGPGKTVITLAPDTGERYFSTPLFA